VGDNDGERREGSGVIVGHLLKNLVNESEGHTI
jgi:hypothetical protein